MKLGLIIWSKKCIEDIRDLFFYLQPEMNQIRSSDLATNQKAILTLNIPKLFSIRYKITFLMLSTWIWYKVASRNPNALDFGALKSVPFPNSSYYRQRLKTGQNGSDFGQKLSSEIRMLKYIQFSPVCLKSEQHSIFRQIGLNRSVFGHKPVLFGFQTDKTKPNVPLFDRRD